MLASSSLNKVFFDKANVRFATDANAVLVLVLVMCLWSGLLNGVVHAGVCGLVLIVFE